MCRALLVLVCVSGRPTATSLCEQSLLYATRTTMTIRETALKRNFIANETVKQIERCPSLRKGRFQINCLAAQQCNEFG